MISESALFKLVSVIIDLSAIGLITWSAWEILVHRNLQGGLTRIALACFIFVIFGSLNTSYLGSGTPDTAQIVGTADIIYNDSVGVLKGKTALASAFPGNAGVQPGKALIEKGVAISKAIWDTIVGQHLLLIPIAWCLIVWVIEVSRGGGWLQFAGKFLFFTVLMATVAGPVTAPLPTTVIAMTSQVASAMCDAMLNPTGDNAAQPPQEKPKVWTTTMVGLAKMNATPPAGLTAISSAYIGSTERSLTAEQLANLKNANYIGDAAQGIVANSWYVAPSSDADPKDFIQIATPIEAPYDLLFLSTEADEFISRNFKVADGTMIDAAKSRVGFIKIGSNADPSEIIAKSYQSQLTAYQRQIEDEIKVLRDSNGDQGLISAKTDALAASAKFKAPVVRPVSNQPVFDKLRNHIQSYVTTASLNKQDVLTTFKASDSDAWSLLWLTSKGRDALSKAVDPSETVAGVETAAGPRTPLFKTDDPYRRWAEGPGILVALARNESSAKTPEASGGWTFFEAFKSIVVMLIMSIAEGGMAMTLLVLKVLVMVFAPLAVVAGLFAVAAGIFICCLAYPFAAYMSLFPGRWAIILDWTKGVMWIMCWIPIMMVGISLCEFNPGDLLVCVRAILSSIPGFGTVPWGSMVGSGGNGTLIVSSVFPGIPDSMAPGAITTNFISTLFGIFMICSSPLIANLVFNPGIGGISSLATSMISQVTGKIAGLGGAALAATGAGVIAGAGAMMKGAGSSVAKDQAVKGAQSSALTRGGGAATPASAGDAMKSLQTKLGGETPGLATAASWQAALEGEGGKNGLMGKVAGRIAAGAAVGGATAAKALGDQAIGQLKGFASMLSPGGITPASARIGQAAAAAFRGDLMGAESLAKGHGEVTSDTDFVGRGGGKQDRVATSGAPPTGKDAKGEPKGKAGGATAVSPTSLAGAEMMRSAGKQQAQSLLSAAGAKDNHEKQEAREASFAHLAAGNKALAKEGAASEDRNTGLNHLAQSMQASLAGGDSMAAGTTAASFNRNYHSDRAADVAEGVEPRFRHDTEGVAQASLGAQRQEIDRAAGARNVASGDLPIPSRAADPERRAQHAATAAEKIQANDLAKVNGQIPTYDGAMARSAYAAACRAGDEGLQAQAAEQISESAAYAYGLPDSDPGKTAALAEASRGMAMIAPSTSSELIAPSSAVMPNTSVPVGSAGYESVVQSARNGMNLVGSSHRPDAGLMRNTMSLERQAMEGARATGNPAHIADVSDMISRTAGLTSRLDQGLPETPDVIMDAAESYQAASVGCYEAADLHDSYAAECESAAESSTSPQQVSQLRSQATNHAQQATRLRTVARGHAMSAVRVAHEGISAAQTGVAIGGTSVERVQVLRRTNERAAPFIGAAAAPHQDQPVVAPAVDSEDPHLADAPLLPHLQHET